MNLGTLDFPPGRGVADAQNSQGYGGLVTGENLHRVNLPAVISRLVPGLVFRYTPLDANTGPVGIVVNGFGPMALVKPGLVALAAGDIQPGHSLQVLYRAPGVFEILGAGAGAAAVSADIANFLDSADKGEARDALGLGTAATRDAGDDPGQVYLIPGSGNIPVDMIDPEPADFSLSNLSGPGNRRIVRAWGSFAGNGTLIDSLGVAAVARPTTGRYTVTLSPALPDAEYSVSLTVDSAADNTPRAAWIETGSRTVNSFKIVTLAGSGSLSIADLDRVSFLVVGG